MDPFMDILGIQTAEQAKDMKKGKSSDYQQGFDDACKLICDYVRESYKTLTDGDDKETFKK